MNKKRTFNIIELILQIFAIILLFVNGAFVCKHCFTFSFMGLAVDNVMALGLIVIFLFIINSILCIVSIVQNKTNKDSVWHISFPIINLVVYYLCSSQIAGHHTCNSRLVSFVSASAVSYLTLLVLFIIIFVSFIKRSVVLKQKKELQQVINNIQGTSNADELKKYKDLLDSGVITKEEFDEKKKQLLGL